MSIVGVATSPNQNESSGHFHAKMDSSSTDSGNAISPVENESVISPDYFHTQMDSSSKDSILIFLAVSGSMVPMRVLESDSIESVKLKIQTCNGFYMKNQKLICRGRELARNDSLIREYGVTDGNVMHLVLRLSDLLVVNVITTSGKKYNFLVEKSRHVGYVKQQIAEKGKGLMETEDQEILLDGEKLEDQISINDLCKEDDAVIHLLVRKSAKIRPKPIEKNFEVSILASDFNLRKNYDFDNDSVFEMGSNNGVKPRRPPKKEHCLEPVVINPKIELSNAIIDLINNTCEGLDNGNYPIRSSEGTGGAYLMRDSLGTKFVSVFKPVDEEPLAENNPRGLPTSKDGQGLKRGTIVGEGAVREFAAYILDHPRSGPRSYSNEERGFAGVPLTFMVKCLHRGFNHVKDNIVSKYGSLQRFVENVGSCEDVGSGAFAVNEVHKISVLDIRLANADRHAGNILISKQGELIPIDHGYCLPSSFEDCTFEWLYWPQSRQPYSADTIEYIKSLDAEEDIALLKFSGWDVPPECARTLRISTMLLKKGVERKLTPYVIGSMMCRETLNSESVIERIIREAHGTSEAALLESVSLIMDGRLDEISKP